MPSYQTSFERNDKMNVKWLLPLCDSEVVNLKRRGLNWELAALVSSLTPALHSAPPIASVRTAH